MGNKTLEEKFEALLENNKGQDWNNLTFRETMMDAFLFCANVHIEDIFKDLDGVMETFSNLHKLNDETDQILYKSFRGKYLK